ncbi:MAG: hypothetical protein A2284_07295 [Deltaproteobacteria bacterium RIFOXYA12_FULL_61_11]|nr:MAG: hypothetical protein A2284_07295 [Deltaproteobacteria bacterium RIFOXYA12_FULL_61_11]
MLLSFFWGMIGLGFFLYGKKAQRIVAMLCGIGLMGFPYLVDNVVVGVVVGAVLTLLPFVLRY